ncbi:uncharacterized protein EDB91DRAFT_1254905 [Suillus paluster]|uniref:uncharacterized protein n=1 Tax=Suillus paluster TaxID=48578 RepID=UPI001B868517|nr:uncharacterized protein EDB91DRAFT_1254905 [Suillus paluster]KAG1725168.1 hypothetical protein EDB91DRAFT_1254905 [Suillus paluster]
MPLQSYLSCTCESFNCKYNPDGSGQKLQTAQTATRHQRADEILVPQADALGQAYGLSEDLTITDSLEHVGNAHQPPDDPGADFDNNSDHGNNDAGDEDILPDDEANNNLRLEAQPHFPELDDLFERWDEPYPANDDPGAFSSDPDAEIFEHLGQLNLEDPVNSDEELGMPAEGNHNDEFRPDNDERLNDIDVALFVSQGANFDFSDVYEDADIHASPPPCMNDHPAVHNAYIWAFISAAFYNATHTAVYHDLEGKEHLLHTAQQANPDIEYPGLDNFARTLPTLLKCLGLSMDQFIIYFFVCDICWKLHHPSVLSELESPECTIDDCDGTLYRQKCLSDGTLKRTPMKLVPYVPPERALQRLFLRPGKWEQFQHWRGPEDQLGLVPPIPGRGYDLFPDPSKPMQDIYDGYGWRMIQAGLECQRGGPWEIEDVDVHELHQCFMSLPCGLVWQINIDWFQTVKGKSGYHSTGAFYAVICNNPREIQYLAEETILLMVIPGPDEPSLEQMNYLIKPFVERVEFRVNGHEDPEVSHSHLYCNVSDLPSSRKTSGLQGHNSKFFMCPTCKKPFFLLSHPSCFDHETFQYRDEWRYIKYSFHARTADPPTAKDISNNRGVRWSTLNYLPGWMPARSSVIEFMHAVFLTMVKHLNRIIILKSGLLNRTRHIRPMEKLEDFFSRLVWPVEATRLPPSLATGKGSPKADQWRNQILVLFIALYDAWQVNGEVPDRDAPPSASNTKNHAAQATMQKTLRSRLMELLLAHNQHPSDAEIARVNTAKMDRSLHHHYGVILKFSAAIRILSLQSISPNDVRRGSTALSCATQGWARMGCHLTPYYHFGMHFAEQMYEFGPCYATWAFAFERHNGKLARVNHNQHKGGELEAMLMQRWWSIMFNYDLILHIKALPNRTEDDEDSLRLLQMSLKAQQKDGQDQLIFAKHPKKLSLSAISGEIYRIVIIGEGENFMGRAKCYSHVWLKKLRYGAATAHRGKSARYAYIHEREPAEIQYLLQVLHDRLDADAEPLIADLAVVWRFISDDDIPDFPWALWATDLGVAVWLAEHLADSEVIPLTALSGHFVLTPIEVRNQKFWITVAYDHTNPEGDVEVDND